MLVEGASRTHLGACGGDLSEVDRLRADRGRDEEDDAADHRRAREIGPAPLEERPEREGPTEEEQMAARTREIPTLATSTQ